MYANGRFDIPDFGERLRQLRQSRGITLLRLSALSGVSEAHLSRLENWAGRETAPRKETIDSLLDALGTTAEERAALYHLEPVHPTAGEIAAYVETLAREYEDDPYPLTLLDDRWFRCYINRAGRAVLHLSEHDYHKVVGEHLLASLFDRRSLLYERNPETTRREVFSERAAGFKMMFAIRRFESWYIDIENAVAEVPWAREIWRNPPTLPLFITRQPIVSVHPLAGPLEFQGQMNQLLSDRRFVTIRWNPADVFVKAKLAGLLQLPYYAYSPVLVRAGGEPPAAAL